MSPSQPAQPPLARLVLFMIVLSIAGSLAAGLHWYSVDLPGQQNIEAPKNFDEMTCSSVCWQQGGSCRNSCPKDSTQAACLDNCLEQYYQCTCTYCKLYC